MIHNILKTIIEISAYSSAMILSVLAIGKLFSNKISSKLIYFLWVLVLVRLILPTTFDSSVHIPYPQFPVATAETSAESQSFETKEYTATDYTNIVITNAPFINAGASEVPTASKQIHLSAETFAVILWLTGFIFFAGGYLIKIITYCKKIRNIATSDIRYKDKLDYVKNTLGIKKNVRICESKYADIPFVYGFFRPIILMPKGFYKSLSNEKLSYIIMHELRHISRKDVLMNYCWIFAKTLHWFNPLIYIAYKSYKNTVEECCDESVTRNLDNKGKCEYLQSLIDTMRFSKKRYYTPLSVSFVGKKPTIRKRVMKMMNQQKKSKTVLFITILIACLMIFACFTTACQPGEAIEDIQLLNKNVNTETVEKVGQTQETPLPTAIVPVDFDNKTVNQPIKRNPLGSEEAAIAVAQRINISNADSFTYISSYERGVIKVHNVTADGDIRAYYHIYDFNGEICALQTSALSNRELGEELSEDILRQKVIDFAMEIYPNTKLNITSCIKDDRTWKVEGVEYQSKDYIVTGKLTDSVDGSIRTFEAIVRLDGCVRSVSAEYNGIDYLGMTDAVRNKVLSYADSEDAEIDIYQIDEYYGDHMLHFTLGDGIGSVTLLGSNKSLVDYLNISNQTDAELNLSDNQIKELVLQYADYYFPGNSGVLIDDSDVFENDYVGTGKITDSRGEMYFYIQLNGDGKVHKIGIRPNVDKESLSKIDQSTALQTAIDTLIDSCKFANESRLEILSEEEYKDAYIEVYKFEFKYTSLNPTIYDYSFNAYINVDVYSGKPGSWRIDYIEKGLDLISKDEAIEKAKEYIVAEYNVDPEKLVFKEFIVMADNILEFQANFDYEDGKSYGASMLADTGERDGVGWGGGN